MIPVNTPMRIGELVRLGASGTQMFWWHSGRRIIYRDVWEGCWRRERISEKDLPESAAETYRNAYEMVMKRKTILTAEELHKNLE